ncbi:MAG: hypothetical protein P9X24_17230 [Candidatus Hatepunaea meridiana]|nr:hypothetical protein [Candidatus Hatepunaea meridiana]
MNLSKDIENSRHILNELRLSQRWINLIASLSYAFAIIILLWFSAFALESIVIFSTNARIGLLTTAVILTIVILTYAIATVMKDPHLCKGWYSEEWWALRLGHTAPDKIRDRLLNAIQINQPAVNQPRLTAHTRPSRQESASTELAQYALYQAVADLKDINIDQAIDKSKRKKSIIATSSSLIFVILLFQLFPLSTAANRLFHPATVYSIPPPFTLIIEPADGWAYRGESVAFTIIKEATPDVAFQLPGRELKGGEVDFIYSIEDGGKQISTVILENCHTRACDSTGFDQIFIGSIEFNGFPNSISYSARQDEITSEEYKLSIVTRPQIAELQYRLFPPRYSRLPMTVGKYNVGDVEALPGSKLEMTIRSNKILDNATLVFLRSGADTSALDSLSLAISGQTGTCKFTVVREGEYHLWLIDNDGHANRDPINYRIRLLADSYPLVRITYPFEDVILGDDMQLPLQIEADDDYGIGKLELAYSLMDQDSIINTIQIKFDSPGKQSITAQQIWNLADMSLFPGDVIEYWAVAWDNDVISGPKRTESERRLVRLPSMEEIVAGVDQSEEAGIEQAQRTLDAAKELREKVNEIVEELRRNPDVDWEKRREMDAALEQQQDIEQQVEELSKRIDDLVEKLEKHDLITAETLEKYQELQNLIAEIASPELKAAMEKLKEAMAAQDPEKVREALEDFDLTREEYLERIERSLSILKQLQLERKMDELVRLTEELLHQQEEILDKVDDASGEELANREKLLERAMDIANEVMKEAQQLAEEADEGALAAQLDSLSDLSETKDIAGQMESAAQSFSQNRKRDGQSKSEQVARDLAELSAGLKKSANELKERRKADLAKKLRRLAEELIFVSQNQEKLSSQSREIGTKSPRYRDLAGWQEDVRMALQGIISRMFTLSKETFFITPDLGASLGKASGELERALVGFSDRRPRSVASPQQKAMGEINRSALKILNILSQLEGASSASGYEEMMEKLSEMASSQQGLNDQSMMMPGGDGEQMMPGGGDQFAKMVAQQRALQEQMQQLSEDASGMQEILGDLEGIAKSMGEVSEDIEDQSITARTRRLQRQIVSRLLDATRSAKEREYSKRRESKIGRQLTRKSPPSLKLAQDRDQLRRDLLRALQEGYTRDYRELIKAYFRELEKK